MNNAVSGGWAPVLAAIAAEELNECKNLTELCELLNELAEKGALDQVDLTDLPVFADEDRVDTFGVWSWDRTHEIRQTSGLPMFVIVEREENPSLFA